MTTCHKCKKVVDPHMATYWDGKSWHRSCAVKFQLARLDSLEKTLKSPKITQIQHVELTFELNEAKEDLKALNQIYTEEAEDLKKLGKIMVRRGFGPAVDTHKLLERNVITPKMITESEKIKQLYQEK